ncbi:MAG: hypothetical protein J7J51_02470, partial [Candidatus Omnitrophica bacterium]|nr:hypothetical protein [Candidatus Omnitrophota bacterium]
RWTVSPQKADTDPPTILDTNIDIQNPTDLNDVNCYVIFQDDTEVQYVDINYFGTELSGSTRVYIPRTYIAGLTGSAGVIIDANQLHPGDANCEFTVVDVAGNSSHASFVFSVSDATAPNIWNITTTPDNNADIDPGTKIRVDANITEYSGLDDVNLYVRYKDSNNNWSDWNIIAMDCTQVGDYNYDCNASFSTLSTENEWQYKIYAKDVNGIDVNTATYSIFAYWDYTWQINHSLTLTSGLLDTNVYVGDLNIVNTGDKNLNFTITTNWANPNNVFLSNTPITANGYTFFLTTGNEADYNIVLTTKTSESQDTLVVTVDANESRAEPDLNTLSVVIISHAQGPFLYVEITDYNSSAYQGDTITLQGRVTNKGNATANNVSLTWSLPSDWSISSGSQTTSATQLAVDANISSTINVSIPSNATTGSYTITLQATADDANTRSTSVTIDVLQAPGTTQETIVQEQAAGTSYVQRASAFGGGAVVTSKEFKQKLFHTTQRFELVRGRQSYFTVVITNPLDVPLTDVNIVLQGFLAQYLKVVPTSIAKLDANESKPVKVLIVAPRYLTQGNFDLNFFITGYAEETFFAEERIIKLEIHEISKAAALANIKKARKLIRELKEKGYYTADLEAEISDTLLEVTSKHNYEATIELYKRMKENYEAAKLAKQKLEAMQLLLQRGKENGLTMLESTKLLYFAESALKRGQFKEALSILKDAESVLAMELNNFNLWFFIAKHWHLFTLLIIGLILFGLGLYFTIRRILWKRKLNSLHREQKLILTMIKATQRRCFQLKEISMAEYMAAIEQYEERLAKVGAEIVSIESKLRHPFGIKGLKALEKEEQRIRGM